MMQRLPLTPLALLVACARTQPDTGLSTLPPSDTVAVAEATATLVGRTGDLQTPESARYDPDHDRFYVSIVNGNPSVADNNGAIVVIRADSLVVTDTLAAGGRNGITLNAPKGMVLVGDTLWVTDIDVVRGFNRQTGDTVATIDFRAQGATFLNDIAVGPDGSLLVTDTGIRFDQGGGTSHPGENRIFRINGRATSVFASGEALQSPNGIAWDPVRRRWIVAPFGGTALLTFEEDQATPDTLVEGPGQFDGLVVLDDGRVIVSSWASGAVHVLQGDSLTTLVTNVSGPADLGFDTRRRVLAVPRFDANVVEYYRVP